MKDTGCQKELKQKIVRFMETIKSKKGFDKVEFIMLYGSALTNRFGPLSDVDICVYYSGSKKERFGFLTDFPLGKEYDVHIFQDLPVFVKREVMKGRLLYCKNLQFLYDIANQTIQEWGFFKKGYYDYIQREGVEIEG